MKKTTKVQKPKCKLVGTDANVGRLASRVTQALKKAGQAAEAKEFSKRLFTECNSYEDSLCLMADYVDIR